MKGLPLSLALPCLFPASAFADVITGFSMDFVEIGDAGNAADDTGYGSVGYAYRMGVNEVSRTMIDSYNTNSGGPLITSDSRGAKEPATNVSWNEAARFVNWLNTSNGHSAAEPEEKNAAGGGRKFFRENRAKQGPAGSAGEVV